MSLLAYLRSTLTFASQIRFDEPSGNLAVTDIGRVASHYYLHNNSIQTFNELTAQKASRASAATSDADVLNLVCLRP